MSKRVAFEKRAFGLSWYGSWFSALVVAVGLDGGKGFDGKYEVRHAPDEVSPAMEAGLASFLRRRFFVCG